MGSSMMKPCSVRQPLSSPTSLLRPHPAQLVSTRHYSAPGSGPVPASKEKYIPKSGTYPRGFLASGIHVGVKASNTSTPDLALIVSEVPCSAAAVFTQNRFQAAPVVVSRDLLQQRGGSGIRAVVVNSGCANAVTGKGGLEDAKEMKRAVDECISSHMQPMEFKGLGQTIVMSTGVIGQRLPIKKIVSKIPAGYEALSGDHATWLSAAKAICTTDTFPKLLSQAFTLPSSPDRTYNLAGMTKGAGMIHPNMATLLGILCTDAPVAPPALQSLLTYAAARSFNSISIDGDTSTNDTLAILANGLAGGPLVTSPPSSSSTSSSASSAPSEDYLALRDILTAFASDLAKLVVRDGEGATKFVTIRVVGSPSKEAAHAIASSIARSPLVKTALYGKDANWGRILCAIGYTPSVPPDTIIPEQTSVSFVPSDGSGELKLLVRGEPEAVDEERARQILEQEDLEILVRLRDEERGGHEACYWTCDFSHEYVTINGDYRT